MTPMGKAARRSKQARTRVDDAVAVISAAQWIAALEHAKGATQGDRWLGGVTSEILRVWDYSRIVLRADNELLGALLDTPDDVELVPDWMTRMPYGELAVSLPSPLPLFDGDRWCTYLGFVVCGIRNQTNDSGLAGSLEHPTPIPDANVEGATISSSTTYYGPMNDGADGVRFLWLFKDEDGVPGAQTLTTLIEADTHRTIGQWIAVSLHMAAGQGQAGLELDTLIRAGISLMLYLASVEPDIDEVPPASFARPTQLEKVAVSNIGWHVGSALRAHRAAVEAGSDEQHEAGPSGWRLPPHIRKAHWHRVRVATRDDSGAIIGDRLGVQGDDWDYQLRWYPPTPVNVDEAGPAPVVRPVDPPAR